MERVDGYKHRFSRYTEAAEVNHGQPYSVGDEWLVTTKPKVPPYYRPRQKRRAEQIIEKALNREG